MYIKMGANPEIGRHLTSPVCDELQLLILVFQRHHGGVGQPVV